MSSTFSACTTLAKHTVMGDQRVAAGTFTISGTADTTAAGLKFVNFAMVTPQSAAGGNLCYSFSSGVISITSATSGNKFNIIAWGK